MPFAYLLTLDYHLLPSVQHHVNVCTQKYGCAIEIVFLTRVELKIYCMLRAKQYRMFTLQSTSATHSIIFFPVFMKLP